MRHTDRFWYGVIVLWALVALGMLFTACDFPMGIVEGENETAPGCALESFQEPWGTDLRGVALARGFLTEGTHLGLDVGLPEGRPIMPIGCGVVRFARAARGYGTFVVVIEHRLAAGLSLLNGNGERVFVDRFLSIYGHLRSTPDRGGMGAALDLRPGAVVTARTVIGYVQHRSLNGDGDEHLHFGIRLQTAEAAQRVDSVAWFRGYDATPTQKGWFADPQDVFSRLRQAFDRSPLTLDGSARTDAAISVDRPSAADRPLEAAARADLPAVLERPDVAMDVSPSLPHDATVMDRTMSVAAADTGTDAGSMIHADAMPVVDASSDRELVSTEALIRYEFRIDSELRVTRPYRLRDLWWRPITCHNTGSVEPAVTSDGWVRCEAFRFALFDGSSFLPDHPDWGDSGQIGTVANIPARCTPVAGASWRLTELTGGHVLYDGPASGLRCRAVGTQDRWQFPE